MVLTQERAEKLQQILSKRMGRSLSDLELETAYKALVEFAVALVDLVPNERVIPNVQESRNDNLPLAFRTQ